MDDGFTANQRVVRDLSATILPSQPSQPLGSEQRSRGLETQLRQSQRQLEQLSIAAQLFSLQLDRNQLLNEIASQACEICRAEQTIVYASVDNRLLARGFSQPQAEGWEFPSEPVLWSSQYLQPRLVVGGTDPGLRSSISIPLVGTQNRVLAVMELRNKRAGGLFNESDMRLANCLGRIATSAVDRALLFSRIEEWTQSMETLLSFNATVNQHLEPDEMVRQLVSNVTGFLDADGGAAGILLNVEPTAALECSGIYYDGVWHDNYRRRWQAKEGIPGTILETEFPFLVSDYRVHPLADPELIQRFQIGCCICVPIKNAQEQVLGFFKLLRNTGKPEFTWQEAGFLESLGNTAAVAIENARLVQSLDRKSQQMKSLSAAHVRRLEEERQHISRELHDETGQVLIGLKLRLQIITGLLNEQQTEAKQELSSLRCQVNDAAARLKDLAKRLRPPLLDELGFEATLRQMVAEFRRQVDFSIELEFLDPPDLPSDVQTALYRIAQESLTNIVKHARARTVRIYFKTVEQWQVFTVVDDGVGFQRDGMTVGLGLVGIKERVKMLGGRIQIRTQPGQGTSIEVSFRHV